MNKEKLGESFYKETITDETLTKANAILVIKCANLEQQVKKQKEVIDKAIKELFILKDEIYKPETREENFEIQNKISSIIIMLNKGSDSNVKD